MGSQSFNVTLGRRNMPLSEALARAPRAFREQAQKGFRILSGLGKEQYGLVVDVVIGTLERGQPSLVELGKRLSMTEDETTSLFAAAMIVVPLLINQKTPEEFRTEATKAGFLPPEVADASVPFAKSVYEKREALGRVMRRSALPSQVLPTLTNVEIVVDIRMDFEDQEVYEAVPVAMFHIDTDVSNTELWFQASKSQLEHFRDDLSETIKRMEIAETWARKGRAS
jgi:hypothetical protein